MHITIAQKKRLQLLTQLIVKILGPVSEAGLHRAIGQLYTASKGLQGQDTVIEELLILGEIKSMKVEGMYYYCLADIRSKSKWLEEERVRFLAPFDPIVWDRTRFEHLWGWPYRFEAYMPESKRQFGYYALPIFWHDQAVGWVNIIRRERGKIDFLKGFAKLGSYGNNFNKAYDEEVSRFEQILSEN